MGVCESWRAERRVGKAEEGEVVVVLLRVVDSVNSAFAEGGSVSAVGESVLRACICLVVSDISSAEDDMFNGRLVAAGRCATCTVL